MNPKEKERVLDPAEKKTSRRATPSRRASVQKEMLEIISIRPSALFINNEVANFG